MCLSHSQKVFLSSRSNRLLIISKKNTSLYGQNESAPSGNKFPSFSHKNNFPLWKVAQGRSPNVISLPSFPSIPLLSNYLQKETKIRETSLTAIYYSFTFPGAAANSENWGGRETAVGGDRKKMKWNQSLKAEE